MTVKVGDKVPSVAVKVAKESGTEDTTIEALFANKKVVLFALPGAFTPTCSAKHLPGFVEKAAELRAKGVDLVACTSVNDSFVMNAWGKAQGVGDKVAMVADGNGDFARAMGLTVDLTKAGMGERSQRYAAIIDKGIITLLDIEAPGKFEVSSVEAILAML